VAAPVRVKDNVISSVPTGDNAVVLLWTTQMGFVCNPLIRPAAISP
jgi:hypothetical protein